MPKQYDIIAIGNALVDVIADVGDDILRPLGLTKGSMTLCTEDESHTIYSVMPPSLQQSGGSAANTLAGLAALGGKAAFLGTIGRDEFGEIFAHDLQSLGVDFTPSYSDTHTGRCLVLVSDDAERTMATHLGAAAEFSTDGVDAAMIGDSHILYLEGYLFDSPDNKQAFHAAADMAKAAGVKVALTLSDSFCVDRHRDDFKKFIGEGVDILFANEQEILSLAETDNEVEGLQMVGELSPLIFMTRSEKGAMILQQGEEILQTPAVACPMLVDTTGAGDQFAAGVVYGLRRGRSLQECAWLGATLASLVIADYGGRLPHPQKVADLLPDDWR